MRKFFLLLMIGMVISLASGCQATQAKPSPEVSHVAIFKDKGNLSQLEFNLNQILALIEKGDLLTAENRYKSLESNSNSSNDIALKAYTHARLLLAKNNHDAAFERLNNATISEQISLSNAQTQLNIGLLNSELLDKKMLYVDALKTRIHFAPLISNEELYSNNHVAIWQLLKNISYKDKTTLYKITSDPEFKNWLELSMIVQNPDITLDSKIEDINKWITKYPHHPAAIRTPEDINFLKIQAAAHQEKIAVLLPFNGKYASIAEAIRDGLMQAFFTTGVQNEIRFYNAGEQDPFLDVYNQAVQDGATLIIGPLFKNQLEVLLSQNSLPVKTIALNKLPTGKIIPNLLQFSLAPEDEIASIIMQCTQSKLINAFILSQNDEFSQKNMATFIQGWREKGLNITGSHSFSETTELLSELEKPLNIIQSKNRTNNLQNLLGINLENNPNTRTDIDVIILFTKPDNAQIINALLNTYLPDNIIKYSNSAIYRGFQNPDADRELNGIVFTEMPLLIHSQDKLPKKYKHSALIRMYAFGMDAYKLGLQLDSMISNQTLNFSGATGFITLKNNEYIRKTDFAIFSNGVALPILQAGK